ncbi:immunity 53 family protein [Stenotrophomonas rhizophila]|uniref:immunity 53 family protein n=1 Tax=Stenotrophomonas rhizophila TaxID=216778 RepID=UPI001E2FC2BA|nr:immunity 53 family protein [Stenotrophomonas rhizophila]MCC7633192.1 immunity 53 family protein [Stenotrophomonas rhizophila]MCC7662085.1 immunity 53 family protein [Stenotrophomonas rhizophila]
MGELQRLQQWYRMQCNEDWEHTFGITIETLDNPGWHVSIDLIETELEHRPFAPVSRGHSEDDEDWINCKLEQSQFVACGGAGNLTELLGISLNWAEGRQ